MSWFSGASAKFTNNCGSYWSSCALLDSLRVACSDRFDHLCSLQTLQTVQCRAEADLDHPRVVQLILSAQQRHNSAAIDECMARWHYGEMAAPRTALLPAVRIAQWQEQHQRVGGSRRSNSGKGERGIEGG